MDKRAAMRISLFLKRQSPGITNISLIFPQETEQKRFSEGLRAENEKTKKMAMPSVVSV